MRIGFIGILAVVLSAAVQASPATPSWDSVSKASPGSYSSGLVPFGFGTDAMPFVGVSHYTLRDGDTVTSVAKTSGLTVETILSFNKIRSPRTLRPGQTLQLPNRDGILVALEAPEPVATLADTYQVYPELIVLANHLPEYTKKVEGGVFIPGGRLDPLELRKMLGEYFLWPTKGGRISSFFGRRNDPFTGERSTHSGVDIANYFGAPALAAGDGVVVATGYDSILGNFIQVNQGQGFLSVYGHLSAILTKVGSRVKGGQLIGKVGSTGYSTGPHLHFGAYRWNKLLNPMSLFG
jgi:murein DD-endopeptidase MepM/ murein hydrolase activator NlpD